MVWIDQINSVAVSQPIGVSLGPQKEGSPFQTHATTPKSYKVSQRLLIESISVRLIEKRTKEELATITIKSKFAGETRMIPELLEGRNDPLSAEILLTYERSTI